MKNRTAIPKLKRHPDENGASTLLRRDEGDRQLVWVTRLENAQQQSNSITEAQSIVAFQKDE